MWMSYRGYVQWRIQGDGDASPTGTHNAPKLAILRSKILRGRGYPLPHPIPRLDHIPTNDFWIRHCICLCVGRKLFYTSLREGLHRRYIGK